MQIQAFKNTNPGIKNHEENFAFHSCEYERERESQHFYYLPQANLTFAIQNPRILYVP